MPARPLNGLTLPGMNKTSRAVLILVGATACWVIYAVLVLVAERQRLPSDDGYGELYGPLAWLRDAWFWVTVAGSILTAAAILVVLLRRAEAG